MPLFIHYQLAAVLNRWFYWFLKTFLPMKRTLCILVSKSSFRASSSYTHIPFVFLHKTPPFSQNDGCQGGDDILAVFIRLLRDLLAHRVLYSCRHFLHNSTHSPANMDDSPIITHSHMLPSSPVCGRPEGSFNVTWMVWSAVTFLNV